MRYFDVLFKILISFTNPSDTLTSYQQDVRFLSFVLLMLV